MSGKSKTYQVDAQTTVDLRTGAGEWSGVVPAGKHVASDELPEWVLVHIVEQQERQAQEAKAAAAPDPAAETVQEA